MDFVVESQHTSHAKRSLFNNVITSLSPPATNVSRRRLAFRPQSIKVVDKSTKTLMNNDYSQPSTSGTNNVCYEQNIRGINESNKIENDQHHNAQNKPKRKSATSWSFQEMLAFYEALKQHGKNFDAIVRHLAKKKFYKDRDLVRKYYFNCFKIWKLKAMINEQDWGGVPRDARELFVILNGCEWRRKTCNANFDPIKFKSLIIDGSTSVRNKRKKSFFIIRTPCCPSLLKFFPYDKRNVEIPSHLSLKFVPLRYIDRNYVISCEQNPFVLVKAKMNDKISNIFLLFEKKWRTLLNSMAYEMSEIDSDNKSQNLLRIRVSNDTQIHKVQIDLEDFPLMSLRKLKRDYDSANTDLNQNNEDNFHSSYTTVSGENSNEMQKIYSSGKLMPKTKDNLIKLKGSSVKEFFDLDENKLKEGMTKENVKNASVLQLYYLCGMASEVKLTYEIFYKPLELVLPWKYFISLLKRDYGELIGKTLLNYRQQEEDLNQKRQESQYASANSNDATNNKNNDTNLVENEQNLTNFHAGKHTNASKPILNTVRKKKSTTGSTLFTKRCGTFNTPLPEKQDANNFASSVVEKENAQFLQQLIELQQSKRISARNQLKVISNSKTEKLEQKYINGNITPQQINSEMSTLDFIKSQQNLKQNLNYVKENTNNAFTQVNEEFQSNQQCLTYVISSTSNNVQKHYQEAIITNSIANTIDYKNQHPVFTKLPSQPIKSVEFNALAHQEQPVFAVFQNNANSNSLMPVLEIKNNSDYNNLTESGNFCTNFTKNTTVLAPIITTINTENIVSANNDNGTTIYLTPVQPTDFSHLVTMSSTTSLNNNNTNINLGLQPVVTISMENNVPSSSTTNLYNTSNSISAFFRSPTKAGYTKRHQSRFQISTNNDNHHTSNNFALMTESELTNVSANEFSRDSFSLLAYVGTDGINSQNNNSQQQLTPVLFFESSPSKTLPDDVKNAYEQMMKENSIDYCKNFEQLTKNMDMIYKNNTSGSSN